MRSFQFFYFPYEDKPLILLRKDPTYKSFSQMPLHRVGVG